MHLDVSVMTSIRTRSGKGDRSVFKRTACGLLGGLGDESGISKSGSSKRLKRSK